ncbi:MAG TPA: hypothetical protein VLI71_07825 [Gammaproteobacteria bacterium]|nr:hypothetical protein [Gammaproteobacteria bacterium]
MKTSREIAAETAKAAAEEAAKPAEPAARPVPLVIQLTEIERINAENLSLKMRLLEADFAAQKQQLLEADRQWTAAVSQRLGVDVTKYLLNFGTGTGQIADGTPVGGRQGN